MNQVLLTGVDSLVVGFCVESYLLIDEEWGSLTRAKEDSQACSHESRNKAIEFRGFSFEVLPSGTGRHNFILRNGDLMLKVRRECAGGAVYPEIQATFSSAFLWREGLEGAYTLVRNWLDKWAIILTEKVSRADLTADVQTSLPKLSRSYKEVITRTRRKSHFAQGDFSIEQYVMGTKESGYAFGKSGDISCRIYDKVLEIDSHSHKRWFHELWKQNGWKPGNPVTRTEFQLRRKVLKQLQCDTVTDLIHQQADLWRYLCYEWLTIRKPTSDLNRSRWGMSRFWSVIQKAVSKFGTLVGVVRLKQQIKPKAEALEKLGRGVLISLASLVDGSLGSIHYKGLTGKQAVRWRVKQWLNDPYLEDEIMRRRAKYATVS